MNQDILTLKIENIKHIMNQIEPHQITILTGSNGSGKSLIRQQLRFKLAQKLDESPVQLTVDISMAKRTSSNPLLGGMSAFMHDDPTDPTSLCTYRNIDTMLKSFAVKEKEDKVYLILDEPEIGMSKESLLGLTNYLKTRFSDILNYTYGMLIITHSEFLVNELAADVTFLNMDGIQTANEWINRPIIPTNFQTLSEESIALYRRLTKD